MASFQGQIVLEAILKGERNYRRLLDTLGKVEQATNRINAKPINLFGKGRGSGLSDEIRVEVDKLQRSIIQVAESSKDAARRATLLGNTFAGTAEKARAFTEVLQNVALKNKGLQNQNGEVTNLARAWAVATEQANEYNRRLKQIQNDALREARGLQPQSVRDAEVNRRLEATSQRRIERQRPQTRLGTLEADAARAAFYAKEREKAEKGIADAAAKTARVKNQELAAARKLLTNAFKLEQAEDKRTRAAIRRIEAEKAALRNRRRQDILTGVGFSALFAGGPTEVLGGGLGAATGGLGGSLIGSAVGRSVDNFIRNAAELGNALDPLTADIERVASASGLASTETAAYLQELEAATNSYTALEAAASLMADRIGRDGVDALKDFGQSTEDLGNSISLFITNISSSVSKFLAPAVDAITKKLQDLQLQGIGERIVAEGGEDAERIRRAGSAGGVAGLEAQRKEIRQILKEREQAVKDAGNAELTLQARVEASLKAYELQNQVLKNRLEYKKELEKLDEEEARKAAEEARKALQAQREMLRMLQTELDLRNQIQDTVLAANQARIGIARLAEGEQAALALERQNASMEMLVAEQRIREQLALDLQAEGANEALLTQLAERKIELLKVEKQLLDAQLAQREKEYLIGLALYKLQTRQQAADQTQRLGRGIEDQQTQLATFGNQDQREREELRIKQARRLEDELQKLYRAEQQLQADRKKATDPKQKGLIQERIDSLQQQRTELEQTLPVMNELEMQNLKLQQSYAKIKPITDEVVGGLLNGIQAVVAGTKTAEEAFADFLNSIAQLLLKTAAEMIATYIAIGIARQFAGLGGGTTAGQGSTGFGAGFPDLGAAAGIPREVGGRTMANMPYVVGEKGAELFVPGKTGTIVPADVFEATRQAISGDGPQGGDSDAFAQNSLALGNTATITKEKSLVREMGMRENEPIDVRYESTVINNVSYVSEEQFQKGMRAAVAQSKASVFSDLKNKPGARGTIGL